MRVARTREILQENFYMPKITKLDNYNKNQKHIMKKHLSFMAIMIRDPKIVGNVQSDKHVFPFGNHRMKLVEALYGTHGQSDNLLL